MTPPPKAWSPIEPPPAVLTAIAPFNVTFEPAPLAATAGASRPAVITEPPFSVTPPPPSASTPVADAPVVVIEAPPAAINDPEPEA